MQLNKAFVYIMTGAALWGTIGWYVKHLYTYGLTPMEVVTLRVWSSAILLLGFMLLVSPKKLRLYKLSDMKYFLGTGILSFIFFNFCMFVTIDLSTLPMATALLYTAPAFVAILSYFLFREPLTKLKSAAILMTITGTAFVAGLIPLNLDILHAGSL